MRAFFKSALPATPSSYVRVSGLALVKAPSRLISHPSFASSFASPTLTAADLAPSVAESAGVVAGTAAAPSERDLAIERLSFDVFGRGNQHLKNVETLTSLPEGLHSFPEVCFIGKPSCGKSSLVSCLLHNRRLAKTGKVRGTTRLLQFFNVGDALLLVDTPGYGGWKGRQVSHRPRDRANAFAILFRYLALRKSGNLKRVYWCIEASATTPMALQARDEEILAFLQREQIPFTIVLTKIDRHWHHYHEQSRRGETVGRDGTPKLAPWKRRFQGLAVARAFSGGADEEPLSARAAMAAVSTPEEGIRQNMAEICAFLDSPDVPMIGVSANRWHPERSMNLLALQHDIVDHCTRDLPDAASLTYAKMHELSYAPPRAEDIEQVQLAYPIEAFVVPEDDNISLQEMVDRHESAKVHLLAGHAARSLLSVKDVAEGFLQDSRALQQEQDAEDSQREALSKLPLSFSYAFTEGSEAAPQLSSAHMNEAPFAAAIGAADGGANGGAVAEGTAGRSTPRPTRFARRASLRSETADCDTWTCNGDWDREDEDEGDVESGEAGQTKALPTAPAAEGAVPALVNTAARLRATAARSSCSRGGALLPKHPVPIPFSLDREAQTVTAINGVRIPRSLIPSSVEDLAIQKEDEMSAFAVRSGAGAYEEMMIYDRLHPDSPQALTFMESTTDAMLPEAVLHSAAFHTRACSAARKQKERMLSKYVDKDRKERSLYMQAEGYMCPWVGQGSSSAAARSIVGLTSTGHAPTGRTGALMKGLKQSGFGGKSYSARTLRGKGRATKKTGSWAT